MAIGELFYQVRVIYNRNGAVWALLMVATVWYLVLTTILSIVQYYVERHYARGAARQLPPTPLQRLRGTFRNVAERARTDNEKTAAAGAGGGAMTATVDPTRDDTSPGSARCRRSSDGRRARRPQELRQHEVLHGIDLTVEPGEVAVVLGASGSGQDARCCAASTSSRR